MATDRVSVELVGVPAERIRVVVHEVDTAGTSTPIAAASTLTTREGHVERLAVDGSEPVPLVQPATLEIELRQQGGRGASRG
jgi:hypothetical protein